MAKKASKAQPPNSLAEGFANLLADTYATYLTTQGAHWNVEGPNFPELHQLFQTQYEELTLAIDGIAEHLRTMGFYAPASFATFAQRARVQPPEDALSAEGYLETLQSAHEAIVTRIQEVLPHAEDDAFVELNDFLVERQDAHKKAAWMLRATLGKKSKSL